MIDKRALLATLLAEIERDRAALMRRQQDTAKGATHEESRAEHAKDTRATEQSYLARGLAARVENLERCARMLAALEPARFDAGEPIALTALVQIEEEDSEVDEEASLYWWLLPVGGGRKLELPGWQIRVLTPASPLGQALLGLEEGDQASFRSPRGPRRFAVLKVV